MFRNVKAASDLAGRNGYEQLGPAGGDFNAMF